jgi:hypothetical protein
VRWLAAIPPLLALLALALHGGPAATAQGYQPPRSTLALPLLYGAVATPTTMPTPNPLSPECGRIEYQPQLSVLANTEFDAGFGDEAPTGWTPFMSPGVVMGPEIGYEKFGEASWTVLAAGAFTAGIYQTARVVPLRTYQAWYATAQVMWGGEYGARDGAWPVLREVGIDPYGGTNPDAPTVVWGRTAGGEPDAIAKKYGGWKTLGAGNAPLVSARAQGQRITMFIRVRGWPDVTRSQTWVDSPFLVRSCPPV